MKRTLPIHAIAAALLLAPLGAAVVAQPAPARPDYYRTAPGREGNITHMSVHSDAGLRPGSELQILARGTPGARRATLALADGVSVRLHERAPGEYVGRYVVSRRDRIDPTRQMKLSVDWGGRPLLVSYDYPAPLQTGAMGNAPAAANVEVSRFSMWTQGERLAPGRVVHFRVEGTPHAEALVRVPGLVERLPLREQRPGTYVGSYTIRLHDDLDAFADAKAVLRDGDQRVVARLNQRG
jgi:hypothetical protein